MIYITTHNEKLQTIHYMPFDEVHGLGKTSEELEQTGFLVEEVPEYTEPIEKGKGVITFYTPEKGFWFEIVETPTEITMAEIEAKLNEHQEVIDTLLLASLGV